ncbi:STE3-domain-containing protein [Coniophora puteana RWD-64-598 SS2]|uniref:STE3-domain-containing protein n=1 Tax=Coniophora puteana (strain RWD-64-598) TaxID=741705 RepID=A0A5M3M8A8_CONPW|nr:STE3-domain-containing protein [Coniophora puteana RWD-64-598 SS2]EIW74901.1 STE3-domain-containing protein [Coniophora puteana RWD-64-598 SS2]
MHAEIPVISILAALCCLAPAWWYARGANGGCVALCAWLFAGNVVYAVNAVVWGGDDGVRASGWCDLSTSIMTGSRIAIPAACLVVGSHLLKLASARKGAQPDLGRFKVFFEVVMCVVLPVIYIVMHLAVQPLRFVIYEGYGCRPITSSSVPSIFLAWTPVIIMSITAVVYAVLAVRRFFDNAHRLSPEFSAGPLILSPIVRLAGLSIVLVLFSFIQLADDMRLAVAPGLAPEFEGLNAVSGLSVIAQVSSISSSLNSDLLLSWVITPLQSFIVAVFFVLQFDFKEVGRKVWAGVKFPEVPMKFKGDDLRPDARRASLRPPAEIAISISDFSHFDATATKSSSASTVVDIAPPASPPKLKLKTVDSNDFPLPPVTTPYTYPRPPNPTTFMRPQLKAKQYSPGSPPYPRSPQLTNPNALKPKQQQQQQPLPNGTLKPGFSSRTRGGSRPPSLDLSRGESAVAAQGQNSFVSISPSPSVVSGYSMTVASSHNSLEADFDPRRIIVSPGYGGPTPTTASASASAAPRRDTFGRNGRKSGSEHGHDMV